MANEASWTKKIMAIRWWKEDSVEPSVSDLLLNSAVC